MSNRHCGILVYESRAGQIAATHGKHHHGKCRDEHEHYYRKQYEQLNYRIAAAVIVYAYDNSHYYKHRTRDPEKSEARLKYLHYDKYESYYKTYRRCPAYFGKHQGEFLPKCHFLTSVPRFYNSRDIIHIIIIH